MVFPPWQNHQPLKKSFSLLGRIWINCSGRSQRFPRGKSPSLTTNNKIRYLLCMNNGENNLGRELLGRLNDWSLQEKLSFRTPLCRVPMLLSGAKYKSPTIRLLRIILKYGRSMCGANGYDTKAKRWRGNKLMKRRKTKVSVTFSKVHWHKHLQPLIHWRPVKFLRQIHPPSLNKRHWH